MHPNMLSLVNCTVSPKVGKPCIFVHSEPSFTWISTLVLLFRGRRKARGTFVARFVRLNQHASWGAQRAGRGVNSDALVVPGPAELTALRERVRVGAHVTSAVAKPTCFSHTLIKLARPKITRPVVILPRHASVVVAPCYKWASQCWCCHMQFTPLLTLS